MPWPWSKKEKATSSATVRRVIGKGEGCLVSKLSTEEGFGVYYIHRSEPEHDLDSGWAICHGSEDDEYVNTPTNWVPYHVDTISELFPAIKDHMKAPIGSAFYWDGSKFVPDPLGSPDMPPSIN